ncbi:MAG: metal-dependent hydrolase [Polyangiaceae bacterium]|nr:metal-dependent hydrolase [Polyangiaceae bacterium]
MANLEATFTPALTFVINNREVLFSKADARVSSLFLWHAVEEIEHRSSAHAIFETVVGDTSYRMKKTPSLARHLKGFFALIDAEFAKHVPAHDLTAGMKKPPKGLGKVPLRDKLALPLSLAKCLAHGHDPAREMPPAWFDTWMREHQEGSDMTRFYGTQD